MNTIYIHIRNHFCRGAFVAVVISLSLSLSADNS